MEDITGLLQELQAPGTPLPRRINILETLRDAFSTLQATPGRFEATVPVLCQVPARPSRPLVFFCTVCGLKRRHCATISAIQP